MIRQSEDTALPLRVWVMRLLLDLSSNHSSRRIHMTQAAFADMLGASRRSVNVELMKLERSDAIAVSHGDIEILKPQRLHEISENWNL